MSTLWTIIVWIVFGLIVGFIARALVPGKDDIGILRTIILGILGSVVGGVVVSLIFSPHTITLSNPSGWIGSVIFAIILLVIYNRITGRKGVRR
jgi:uncharacterized membrane protein YeaQ/YmgE (transglycosylase-associated protein family)